MRTCLLAIALTIALQMMSQGANSTDNAVWYNARHGDAAAMNQLGIWYYSGNKVNKDYRQAYDWWRQGALLGNVKAIANLGVCYQYGRGVDADSIAAMQLYMAAISGGQTELLDQRKANVNSNPFDAMLVGSCYERGIGTTRDMKQAAQMYAAAAGQGSVDGMLSAADALLATGVAADALQMYERGAAAGNVECAYMAGKMLMGGMGVAENSDRGIQLIRKAADAGMAQAQGYLGALYNDGRKILRDEARAAGLLSGASAAGDTDAMWQYGTLLAQRGDYDRALYWMSLAAQASGIGDFNLMYRKLPKNDPYRHYIDGMRSYCAGDYRQAVAMFSSVNEDITDAGRVMEAAVLADPANSDGNAKKAAKTLDKLTFTSPQAAYILAGLYMDGRGVKRDTDKAISLYRQAANAGYGPAQDTLAGIYYQGVATTVDRQGAMTLYDKAYRQRALSAEGAKRLGGMYRDTDRSRAARLAAYDAADPVAWLMGAMSGY